MQQSSHFNDNTFLNVISPELSNKKKEKGDINKLNILYENLKTEITNLQKKVVLQLCEKIESRNKFDEKKKNITIITDFQIGLSNKKIQTEINTIIQDTNYYIYQALIDIITTQNQKIRELITSKQAQGFQNTQVYICNSIISTIVNKLFLKPITNILEGISNNIISVGEYDTGAFNISLLENIPNPIKLPNVTTNQITKIQTNESTKYNYFITVGKMFNPTIGAMAFGNNQEELKSNAENIYNKKFDKKIALPSSILFINFGEIGKMHELYNP